MIEGQIFALVLAALLAVALWHVFLTNEDHD